MSGNWSGSRATKLTGLVLNYYGTTCHLCGYPGATTADHLVPRSKGGDNSLDNMRPAHHLCNSRRGNKSLEQWHRERIEGKHPTPWGMSTTSAEPSRNW